MKREIEAAENLVKNQCLDPEIWRTHVFEGLRKKLEYTLKYIEQHVESDDLDEEDQFDLDDYMCNGQDGNAHDIFNVGYERGEIDACTYVKKLLTEDLK